LGLNEVIERSARGVEEALPQKTMVAVLNFASPSDTFSDDYVIEELTGELVRGRKVTVVDRKRLALIRDEMNLQQSGEVSDESAQALGRLLGAKSIVSGTLTDMGTYYRFRINVISVETAAIQTQVSLDLKNDQQVAFLLGGNSSGGSVSKKKPVSQKEPAGTGAAARDNWISGEIMPGFSINKDGLIPWAGIGVSYERMLGSKISLGGNAYYGHSYSSSQNEYQQLGIDAFFRFYPWGKTFFLGFAVGYSHYEYKQNEGYFKNITYDDFSATEEFGWKIDVGKPGGFYIQPSLVATWQLFTINSKVINADYDEHIFLIPKVYLGAGYAF